jgi:hypothetical protein
MHYSLSAAKRAVTRNHVETALHLESVVLAGRYFTQLLDLPSDNAYNEITPLAVGCGRLLATFVPGNIQTMRGG